MTENSNPYEAPSIAEEQGELADRRAAGGVYPFRSGSRRARWAIGLIVACLVSIVFTIAATLLSIDYLQRSLLGETGGRDELPVIEMLGGLAQLFRWATHLAAGIVFLNWLHLAYRNLWSLGARTLRYTPGWAVGYYFIPLLNFFRPYQVMKEIWHGSDPGRVQGLSSNLSPPRVVVCWWTLWIMAIIVRSFGVIYFSTAARLGGMSFLLSGAWLELAIRVAWIEIVAELLRFGAGIFAILVIRTIDKNQTARHELMQTDVGAAHLEWVAANVQEEQVDTLEEEYHEAILYGVDLIADRTHYFPDWSASMTRELGEWIEPRLDDIFQLAKTIGREPRERWNELIEQASGSTPDET